MKYLAAVAALAFCGFALRPSEPPTVSALKFDHAATRLRDIDTEIALMRAPSVIVVGDSITEEAPWPSEVCGRKVVNGGVGTANTDRVSALMQDFHWLRYQPHAIVIATGMNDSHKGQWSETAFRRSYESIVAEALTVTPNVMVATITPVDYRGEAGQVIDPRGWDTVNGEIRDIASKRDLTIIPLDAFPTRDGVHGTEQGRRIFATTILDAVKAKLDCN